MKKQLLTLLSAAIIGSASLRAQNVAETGWCHTHSMTNEIFEKDPVAKQRHEDWLKFVDKYVTDEFIPKKGQKGPVRKIPVVFHVIHNFGSENLSEAVIANAIKNMNDDFRKRKADSAMIQAPFNLIHPDCEIEFVLAKKDPNGNPSTGVTRTISEQTYEADNGIKSLIRWPNNKYLNVWTVANIASGAGGWSHLPGIDDNLDGIVLRADQLSALTHEAGHWLGLPHPWGPTNDNNLASNCDFDDFYLPYLSFNDTPNTRGQSSCGDLTRNSCNDDPIPFKSIYGDTIWPAANGEIHDNVQNYMDYAFCGPENFTQGQNALMQATLDGSTNGRNNLWTPTNLAATGTDGNPVGEPIPVAVFDAGDRYNCTNSWVSFMNGSYNSTNMTYAWEFEGADPSTSDESSPSVKYPSPGTYMVKLTVSSPGGSSSSTKEFFINTIVDKPTLASPFYESFESSTFPTVSEDQIDKNWIIDWFDNTSTKTWKSTTAAASHGNQSVYIDLKNSNSNSVHALVSPSFVFDNTNCSDLTFDVAYARRSSTTNDVLTVYVSDKCGREGTWKEVGYTKSGSTLQTTTALILSETFVPTASEWRRETVDISKYTGKNLTVKFEVTSKKGNGIYIDNVNFACSQTGINEVESFVFTLYPNPADNGNASIQMKSNTADIFNVTVTDLTGKVIGTEKYSSAPGVMNTINVSEIVNAKLNSGIYFITVSNNNSVKTEKLVVK